MPPQQPDRLLDVLDDLLDFRAHGSSIRQLPRFIGRRQRDLATAPRRRNGRRRAWRNSRPQAIIPANPPEPI
jgi:hypothetical protein